MPSAGGALVLLCLLRAVAGRQPVQRHTTTGTLQGFLYETEGVVAEVFLGVPFAKPPVGDLRLENPQPLDDWSGVRNATERPPWCMQFWFADPRLDTRHNSEDCLYFNLYVPHKLKDSRLRAPYPILVWVHGGSYQVNGANMFPSEGTVRNLVSRGIAVLFLNYRLGPLGFLSLLNEELPGNYGLEDQIMVLQWVQDNGAAFDIDSKQVTLGGESAGAGSASILATSPRTAGLFHRVILRSGSSLTPWAVRTLNTNLNSELFISSLDCGEQLSNTAEVKTCLQKGGVGAWVKAWRELGAGDIAFVHSKTVDPPLNLNHPFLAHTYFTPVMDNVRGNASIIPTYAADMVRHNVRMPAMIGVTSGECAAYVMWLYFVSTMTEWGIDLSNLEYVVPRVIYKNKEQVKEAVFDRYIRQQHVQNELNYGRTLVQIVSDQNFIQSAVEEAKLYAAAGLPVYAYQFDHTNEYLRGKHEEYRLVDIGAAHGYDMVFLFQNTSVLDPSGLELNWTAHDRQVTAAVADSVASFVRHGRAQVRDVLWPEYTVECGRSLLMRANNTLAAFYPKVHAFWTQVIPVITSLSLSDDFKYYQQPTAGGGGDCEGATICPSHVFYRTAFFIALAIASLLFLAVLLSLCARHRLSQTAESYKLPVSADL